MPRRVSCRRCGKPSPVSLCEPCRAATYGSAEYAANARMIVREVWRRRSLGMVVHCVICDTPLLAGQKITVEHIRSVSRGGSSELSNLGPAHSRCNYSKRPAY